VLDALDPILVQAKPDLVLVQGDTTTTLAGALAAFHRKVPVGHVEAGLRSGNRISPFPEEMNRRLTSQLADLHFAATEFGRRNLLVENVPSETIFVTGNPVVDALHMALERTEPSPEMKSLLDSEKARKVITLTTHRRESFGEVMEGNLRVLHEFLACNPDVVLVFPVHPNPNVKALAEAIFRGADRAHLVDPIEYFDFIHLLKASWLVCSDSGGIQEEAPSLGCPLIILRENTERPEVLETGMARMARNPSELAAALDEASAGCPGWAPTQPVTNPFGSGDSGRKIAEALHTFCGCGP
jgi:UDP-N-acetylglucosamine 2-epimerase (non-hydrolysing)